MFFLFSPVFAFHFRTQEIPMLGLQQKLTWTLGSCFIQCLGLLIQSLKLKPSTYLKGMIKITVPYKKRKEILQLNGYIFFNGKITCKQNPALFKSEFMSKSDRILHTRCPAGAFQLLSSPHSVSGMLGALETPRFPAIKSYPYSPIHWSVSSTRL